VERRAKARDEHAAVASWWWSGGRIGSAFHLPLLLRLWGARGRGVMDKFFILGFLINF
jgi:hypothetical protein